MIYPVCHFRPDKVIYQQNKTLKYTNIVNIALGGVWLRTIRLRFWISKHSYMRERDNKQPSNTRKCEWEWDGESYRSACVRAKAWARWRHGAPANHHLRKRRHELAKCGNIFRKSFFLVLHHLRDVSMKFWRAIKW